MSEKSGPSRVVRLAVAAAMAAGLAACTAPPLPADQFYRLTPTPPLPLPGPPVLEGNLMVERPEADGLLAGRPIVFTTGDPESPLIEYDYLLWEKAPALLVRDGLIDCLSDANVAGTVTADTLRVRADTVLTGRIERLERIESTPPRAVIALRLGIADNRTGELQMLRTYTAERVAADDSMAATVAAFNAAFSEVCADLVTEIAGL